MATLPGELILDWAGALMQEARQADLTRRESGHIGRTLQSRMKLPSVQSVLSTDLPRKVKAAPPQFVASPPPAVVKADPPPPVASPPPKKAKAPPPQFVASSPPAAVKPPPPQFVASPLAGPSAYACGTSG